MVRRRRSGKGVAGLILCFAVIAVFYILHPVETKDNSPGGNVPTSAVEALSDLDGDLVVSFIDVGQGDSILLEQGEETMLIDCGPASSQGQLLDYLSERELDTIDYLVLTHPHEDHIGGAVAILESYPVEAVYMPDKTHTTSTYGDTLDAIRNQQLTVTTAQAGDRFSLGDATVEIVGPVSISNDLNNCSIVLRLAYEDVAFLFTGDAEAQEEADILNNGLDVQADVLKVGHHGSSSSTYQDFLEAVDPEIAVISCGEGNDYGHPHQETLDILYSSHISTFRTDEQGTILAISDGQTVTIYTER